MADEALFGSRGCNQTEIFGDGRRCIHHELNVLTQGNFQGHPKKIRQRWRIFPERSKNSGS
jgi:hypothetical protein